MNLPAPPLPAMTLPKLLFGAFVLATLAAAVVLHVSVAIVAPGDGGTALALASGIILFVLVVILAIYSFVPFLLLALLSWPLRWLVYDRPLTSFMLAAACGTAVGYIALLADLRVGPDDNWSGPLVGAVYGIAWFLMVRRFGQRIDHSARTDRDED